MRTSITLRAAMIEVSKRNAKMAAEDIEAMEKTGYPKHFMFAYAQENEEIARQHRVRFGTVDMYEKI